MVRCYKGTLPIEDKICTEDAYHYQRTHYQQLAYKMKDKADVIRDFNNVVNMTAAELEKWLKSGTSKDAGWSKDDGGESIGHDSGRKIVQILKDNPQKNPDKYTDEYVEHMRKVVSYWYV